MLSFNLKNLANKSYKKNNGLPYTGLYDLDTDYKNERKIIKDILENSYNINLDTSDEWNTITLQKTKITTNASCSGIYYVNKGNEGYIITAAHCIANPVEPGADPTGIYLEGNFKPTIPPNINLGYIPTSAHFDAALLKIQKVQDYNYIDNVYILSNPEDLIEGQELFYWGATTGATRKVKINRGSELDKDTFYGKWFQDYMNQYWNNNDGIGHFNQGIELLGFDLYQSGKNITDVSPLFKNYLDGMLLPTAPPSAPGDSGGPVFIPFGKDKIALVGITSEKAGNFAPYTTNFATKQLIPKLQERGIRVKEIKVFYDKIFDVDCGPYFYEPKCIDNGETHLYNPYND